MAFHPYPQLIRALFNVNRFGPPAPVTAPSAWPGVDRKVSRPPPATRRPLRARSRSGSAPQGACPRRRRATRRLIMQKARRHHRSGSDRLQAHGFRFSFTPLSGVLFTFPSRYSSTIGLPVVLSLGGWCRRIRTGLLRPRPTQGSGLVRRHAGYGAVTPCGPPSQACSPMPSPSFAPALQPRARLDARGLGWPPFARRYSGGHCCFPFLRLLGCFGSSGWPPPTGGCRASARRVPPFGHPRIHGCSRLPAAFRGLPRPSSPLGATGIPRAPLLARSPPGLSARGPLSYHARVSLVSLVLLLLASTTVTRATRARRPRRVYSTVSSPSCH